LKCGKLQFLDKFLKFCRILVSSPFILNELAGRGVETPKFQGFQNLVNRLASWGGVKITQLPHPFWCSPSQQFSKQYPYLFKKTHNIFPSEIPRDFSFCWHNDV
jgi:hypothetical protein